jgi:hypothetical protein
VAEQRDSPDIDPGMVKMTRYRLIAATYARPIPVLPPVGSTIVIADVIPGRNTPRYSASSISAAPK